MGMRAPRRDDKDSIDAKISRFRSHRTSSKRLFDAAGMLDVLIGWSVVAARALLSDSPLLLIASASSVFGIEWVCNLIRRMPNSLWEPQRGAPRHPGLSLPPALPSGRGSRRWYRHRRRQDGLRGLGANVFNPAMVGRAF